MEEVTYELTHDTSNPLVITGKKKKKKKPGEESNIDGRGRLKKAPKKTLTKKQRKRLEKVVERKKKVAKRGELLTELSKYVVPDEELDKFSSFARINQKEKPKLERVVEYEGNRKRSSLSGKRIWPEDDRRTSLVQPGPYFETDSSSSDEESEFCATIPETKSEPIAVVDTEDDNGSEETGVSLIEISTEASTETENVQKASEVEADQSITKKIASESIKTTVPATYIPVHRTKEIQKQRLELPILAEEQAIVEAINDNPIVIVCGETGSGKTTQVPQFLYEAGYTSEGKVIGVTEPRRVAAMSMSRRVGEEMNLPTSVVSYQIRYEGNAGEETKIKFMTDGVLMKEMQKDIRLSSYSVIIIDEAHERSMYSDILIGLLSRIVPLRHKQGNPLKLIVMSATLRVQDFTSNRLFRVEPTVFKVDSRQYPVDIHFNKRTPENYLLEAYKKVCKIHAKLPEGGILVFVSGQREVKSLISWLRQKYPVTTRTNEDLQEQPTTKKRRKKKSKVKSSPVKKIDLDSYPVIPSSSQISTSHEAHRDSTKTQIPDLDEVGVGEEEGFEEWEGGEDEGVGELEAEDSDQPLFCLPLYSLLPTEKQARVFLPPPDGMRLCVVATNVAETSLTIPNVKYVVDAGKEKVRLYDPVTGVSQFIVQWTSKASSDQRTGRAGRVGPGHCYRLFSSAVFNHDFPQYSVSDILNKPVDELVLQMKSMNIVRVENFPFPTPPDKDALVAAESKLVKMGALEYSTTKKSKGMPPEARITSLGKTIATFPVRPHFGKMLSLSNQKGLLPYAVCLVAGLSVREPLINLSALQDKDKILKCVQMRRRWAGTGQCLLLGDLSVLLKAIGAAEYEKMSFGFCEEHGLRHKAMIEIRKLRKQLTNLINGSCLGDETELVIDPHMEPPTEEQAKLLRQIFLSGMAENVAKKVEEGVDGSGGGGRGKVAYQTQTMKDPVFLHPTSVLYRHPPEYLIYQEITSCNDIKYIHTVCAMEKEWFAPFVPTYCQFQKLPIESKPRYDPDTDRVVVKMKGTFGPLSWPLGTVETDLPEDLNHYRWFGCLLLEGDICQKLREFRPKLLVSPSVMTKSWAHLQSRTDGILKALVDKNVTSKKKLLEMWDTDSIFLLDEYCDWLPEVLHSNVQSVWPPTP